jgi:hypothetical protein
MTFTDRDGNTYYDLRRNINIVSGDFVRNPNQWRNLPDFRNKPHYTGRDTPNMVDLDSLWNPSQTWWGRNAEFRVRSVTIGEPGCGSRISLSILGANRSPVANIDLVHFNEINAKIFNGANTGRVFSPGTYLGRTNKIVGLSLGPHVHVQSPDQGADRDHIRKIMSGQ